MNVIYPAVFYKEGASYWAEFPDLQGCQTYGDTPALTLINAKEALAGYCAVLLEQGFSLPAPTNIENIKEDGAAFVSLVDAKIMNTQKAVKKTLTIPAWLNTLAEEAHAPYSKLLQDALEDYLGLSER